MTESHVTPAGAATAPVKTWLVTGARASAREAAIADHLQRQGHAGQASAIILEGLSDDKSSLVFDDTANAAAKQKLTPNVIRIAPGCLHCSGNLILRVTLNRVLRQPPAQLYISLASAEHLEQLRAWLASPPYDALLELQSDIAA